MPYFLTGLIPDHCVNELLLFYSQKWQRKWFSLDNSGNLNFFDSDKVSRASVRPLHGVFMEGGMPVHGSLSKGEGERFYRWKAKPLSRS